MENRDAGGVAWQQAHVGPSLSRFHFSMIVCSLGKEAPSVMW